MLAEGPSDPQDSAGIMIIVYICIHYYVEGDFVWVHVSILGNSVDYYKSKITEYNRADHKKRAG